MTMPRRTFLGLGALAALSAASPALADRRRILTVAGAIGARCERTAPRAGACPRPASRRQRLAARRVAGVLARGWPAGEHGDNRDAGRSAGVRCAGDHRARSADRARAGRGKSRQGARPPAGRRDPGRRQAEPRAAGRHPAAAAEWSPADRGVLRRAGALERGAARLREQVDLCRPRPSAQGVRPGRSAECVVRGPGIDQRACRPRRRPRAISRRTRRRQSASIWARPSACWT